MPTITKSRLKAEMLGVFRKLERTGGELIVTDRGRPVLKISPVEPARKGVQDVFADVYGKVVYREDILKSTEDEWTEV
jgi:antitoxin (DNA-binding transcriptional repressor) of toxin-antitoxin stability system